MPYVINIYRKPKPGNFKAVRDAAITSLDVTAAATGKRGFVTGTMSHPRPAEGTGMIVTATGGIDSVEELDAIMDASFENDEILDRIERVNALCDSTANVISRVLPSQSSIPENFKPKWVMRDMQIAKPGQLPSLIDYLTEWREEGLGVRTNVVFTIPLGKMNLSSIRLTAMFESIADMEAASDNIMSSPRVPGLLERLDGSPVRVISRILHRTGF